jgi:hypothetical protein
MGKDVCEIVVYSIKGGVDVQYTGIGDDVKGGRGQVGVSRVKG